MRNDFCSNYLEHSAKGSTWKDHRYISKKLVNGKWVYFYNLNSKAGKGEDYWELNDPTGKHGPKFRYTYSLKTRNKKSAIAGREARAEIGAITRNGHYGETGKKGQKNRYFDKDMNFGRGTQINKNYREAEYQGRKGAEEAAARLREANKNNSAEREYKQDKPVAYYVDKGAQAIKNLLSKFKTTETVRITSNLMPANTEKVYKKKK